MAGSEEFSLSVLLGLSGKSLVLEVTPQMCIHDLAERLSGALKIKYPEFSEARILLGTDELPYEETLASAGLGPGSEVQVVVKPLIGEAVDAIISAEDFTHCADVARFLSAQDLEPDQFDALFLDFSERDCSFHFEAWPGVVAMATLIGTACRDPAPYVPRLMALIEMERPDVLITLSEIDKNHEGALTGMPTIAVVRAIRNVSWDRLWDEILPAGCAILGKYGDTSAIPTLRQVPRGSREAAAAIDAIESRAYRTSAAAAEQGCKDTDEGATAQAVAYAAGGQQEAVEETEADLATTLARSEEELPQQEAVYVQEALLRSKAEMYRAEKVIVARLTSRGPARGSAFLGSASLAGCLSRFEGTGLEPCPSWANGATLLVPLSEEQIRKEGITLRAHNITMLESDWSDVMDCLAELPKRRRPQLKPDVRARGGSSSASKTPDETPAAEVHTNPLIEELVVERTFLAFSRINLRDDVTHSAPAGSDLANPRRWG